MNERQFCILTASSGPVAKSSSSLDIEETNFPWKIEEKFILVVVRISVFDENRALVRARVLTVLHQIFKTWFKFCFKFYSPLKFEIVTKFERKPSLTGWKVHWTSVLKVMGSDPSGFSALWQCTAFKFWIIDCRIAKLRSNLLSLNMSFLEQWMNLKKKFIVGWIKYFLGKKMKIVAQVF